MGPWYRTPGEWLPGAKSVVSFFFPITKDIRENNAAMTEHASPEWASARFEGQHFLEAFIRELGKRMEEQGFKAVVPILSADFAVVRAGRSDVLAVPADTPADTYASNWSERHAAYVCGLGTFSLTRGMITEKGMAGRFVSFVTDAELPADARDYEGIYDRCLGCGVCAARCPVGAIDPVTGKDQLKCAAFNAASRDLFSPRYGCGLCQTGVPCEDCIPGRQKA